MPTTECAAISATPVMGAFRKERPITSAQINSISPKVQMVPMAARPSSSVRTGSKGCGAAAASSAAMSMSSAMAARSAAYEVSSRSQSRPGVWPAARIAAK